MALNKSGARQSLIANKNITILVTHVGGVEHMKLLSHKPDIVMVAHL